MPKRRDRGASAELSWWTRLLILPLRAYVLAAPTRLGKGFVQRRLIRPLLPAAPASFEARLEAGTIQVQYREQLGMSILLHGGFETAEVCHAAQLARPGTWAVDAGANVGLYTVALAAGVGRSGRVLAFEPDNETAARLADNLAANRLQNVELLRCALSAQPGRRELFLAGDSAFNTLRRIPGAPHISVDAVPLDDVWERAGRPDVSVVKIDVEGAEMEVLAGSARTVAACRPAVILEAPTPAQLRAATEWFDARGYAREQPEGYRPWNYIFLPAAESAVGAAQSAA